MKVALLLTSQSMADGDEAVTGLMALHVLERGVHPIYPYGVQYGAGSTVETHLAAALFALFGVSGPALKGAGLLIWLASLAVVGAVARLLAGGRAAAAALVLYAAAPQGAEWSLKVGGGHATAVLLCLVAILLLASRRPPWAAAAILPLAAFAHPIVAPFCAVLALALLWRGPGARERLATLAALLLTLAGCLLLLAPPGAGVWNPAARGFDPVGLAQRLPALVATLFSPNLNSAAPPSWPVLLVSLLWLGAFLASAPGWRAARVPALYLLAPLGVLLVVSPAELAPRHLLLLYPLTALALAIVLAGRGRAGFATIGLLAVSGLAVQAATIASPVVHGPAPQDRGIVRENVREIVHELETRGVHHVYCLDPMFQWNLIWESRERILARWADPSDRLPEYPARVDEARRRGLPFAVVGEAPRPSPRAPQVFRILPSPSPADLETAFPPAGLD